MGTRDILLIASIVINLFLWVFIWSKGIKNKVYFYLGILAFFSAFYAFPFLAYFHMKHKEFWAATTWWGELCVASSVAFIFYYTEGKPKKRVIPFFFIFGTALALLGYTPLMRPMIEVTESGIRTTYGPLEPLGRLYTIAGLFLVCYKLIRAYRKSSGHKKLQIKYFLLGYSIYVISGIFCVGILPLFKIRAFVEYIPSFFSVFWVGLTVFAIIRYRLFDIETVIHRTFLWIVISAAVFLPILAVLYFIRDPLHIMSKLELSLVLTLMFFGIIYYYRLIQPRINHLFRRKKYDYYRVLDEIGQKVGSELDLKKISDRLFRELKEILYVRNAILLVKSQTGRDYEETASEGYGKRTGTEKKGKITLSASDALSSWIIRNKKALEREQLEIDPAYGPVKQEALMFFGDRELELLIPVVMEESVNGLVGLGKKENLQPYTLRDIELLEKMGRQIGVTIDNAIHHEDIVEKERIAEELRLGQAIQTGLLPQTMPLIPGLSVYGLMQPAREIGGDYYDFIPLGMDGRYGIVIGDVSGKGVAAGLCMAMVKTAIHIFSRQEESPKSVLLAANDILNRHIGGEKFMTLLYMVWQAEKKTLAYSSAGHEHILVHRAGADRVEAVPSGGIMLGVIPSIGEYLSDREIVLSSGDKILLYTDGVTEAHNRHKDRFGLERLMNSFQRHSIHDPLQIMQEIKKDLYSFIGNHPQYDDITLVVMEKSV